MIEKNLIKNLFFILNYNDSSIIDERIFNFNEDNDLVYFFKNYNQYVDEFNSITEENLQENYMMFEYQNGYFTYSQELTKNFKQSRALREFKNTLSKNQFKYKKNGYIYKKLNKIGINCFIKVMVDNYKEYCFKSLNKNFEVFMTTVAENMGSKYKKFVWQNFENETSELLLQFNSD